MYLILVDNVDVTSKVERKSLRIVEQLNNRRNTAQFRLLDDFDVEEHQKVEIYKYREVESISAATITLMENENGEDHCGLENRFFEGQEVILNPTGTTERINIASVGTLSITLESTPTVTVSKGSKVAVKIYGGTVNKIPDDDIGKSNFLVKTVSCVDYSFIFNKENIVDTYEDMYPKEIISRIVHKFTSRDSEELISNCESGFTAWGNARPVAYDSENITGSSSLKLGATNTGAGGYTLDFSGSPIDCSNFEDVRLWVKSTEDAFENVNYIVVKIGQNWSNHYRFEITFEEGADLWEYIALSFSKPTAVTWSPNLSAIDWLSIDFSTKQGFASGDFLIDEIVASSWGFTLGNVSRGNIKYEDVRVQYRRPDDFLETLAKTEGYFWYIDYDRDIHFFPNDARENEVFSISPTSNNYQNLKRTVDVNQLKNRQTIRGGLAPAESSFTQEYVTDGVQDTWEFAYPPQGVTVEVDTGGGYVSASVGVENLVDETLYDYVFNFSEKTLRRANAAVLAAGSKIKYTYIPYKAIRVRYQDPESIAAMKLLTGGSGVYDGAVINDESIRTFSEARARARAEIEAYKNPIVTISFSTDHENIKTGQLLHIIDPARGLDDKFLVQKVVAKSNDTDFMTYNITTASTMFGYIEFFQLLFKRTEKGLIDVNELVDIIINVDDTIVIDENYVLTQKGDIFYAMGPTPNETPNDAYASFSQAY